MVSLAARIQTHQSELLGFLRRRAPDDAEELAQEVWLRVARVAPECPDETAFRAYIFTVARRLLIDHWRAKGARVVLVPLEGERDAGSTGDPEQAIGLSDVLDVVESELSAMNAETADVFRWRVTEDVSFRDIAARQGTGVNTSLGRMHRATLRIAAALRERGWR